MTLDLSWMLIMSQPNVVFVLTDDQGYGDLSCLGNPVLRTPCIDRFHDESVRFTDFHVAPMCTPTRGELLTGTRCVVQWSNVRLFGTYFVAQRSPHGGGYLCRERLSHGALRKMAFG